MSQQIYKEQMTKQVRIDKELHRILRIEAANKYTSIRKIIEEKIGWKPNKNNPE